MNSVDATTIVEINGDRYVFDPTDDFKDLVKMRPADALDEGYSSEGMHFYFILFYFRHRKDG